MLKNESTHVVLKKIDHYKGYKLKRSPYGQRFEIPVGQEGLFNELALRAPELIVRQFKNYQVR